MAMAGEPETGFAGAVALHRAGRLAEAIALYRDLIATDPENDGIRLNLGAALAATGDRDGAAAAYDAILQRAPDHAGALYNLGNLRRNAGEGPRRSTSTAAASRSTRVIPGR